MADTDITFFERRDDSDHLEEGDKKPAAKDNDKNDEGGPPADESDKQDDANVLFPLRTLEVGDMDMRMIYAR